MAKYLSDSTIFEHVPVSWASIAGQPEVQLDKFGHKPGKGSPYTYGIFRYIAGTRQRKAMPRAQTKMNRHGLRCTCAKRW